VRALKEDTDQAEGVHLFDYSKVDRVNVRRSNSKEISCSDATSQLDPREKLFAIENCHLLYGKY